MWKKDEMAPSAPGASQSEVRPPHRESPRSAGGATERATIGPSITIKGDVTGDEDLVIDGKVEGSVELKQQSVTVGRQGKVKANIRGRVIVIEGEVTGDLHADEQVVLRGTARVQGDISAARVVLEDGANFRGLVEMGESGHGTRADTAAPATQTRSTGSGGGMSSKPGGSASGTSDGDTKETSKDSSPSSSSRVPSRGDKTTTGTADSATH